ncbi:MAG: hypothetical protein RIT43_736 [Bacteroidota bacterium]|jgi:hypothetical protein
MKISEKGISPRNLWKRLIFKEIKKPDENSGFFVSVL